MSGNKSNVNSLNKARINSLDELIKLQESLAGVEKNPNGVVIAVGMATCGIAAGARAVMDAFAEGIAASNLSNVNVVATGCLGYCYAEPLIEIRCPGGESLMYGDMNEKKAKDLLDKYIAQGVFADDEKTPGMASGRLVPDSDGNSKQVRIALKNCGLINPEKIEDYIAERGYEALGQVIFNKSQQEVIDEVKKSGLRGRGGAGFPTGVKWEACFKSQGDKKYVVCNADEGDPGAFMDRSILEGDPHSVLEAMAIAGRAVGADEGVIYIRAEYPLAVERLNIAIAQAVELGLLGNNILGSDFSFNLSINLGAGAFVCGEETSLLNSIQGGRGEPRVKPPFPAQKGLWNMPTNINNVETYANVPQIILRGADWFRETGTEKSKGTKVFALAGKINNVGLVEVPMGTTVREVVYDIGGGIRNDKKLKSIQTGGPSGGCIPSSMLDLQIDYDSLTSIGSMMGSGGMIVLDEDDCMVNIAKYYLEFTVDESCGKCTPCRIGNRRLHEVLERITKGNGTMADLDELTELGEIIRDCSLCGLGQSAPNPVLTTLKYFYDEYVAHVVEKRCPAGACKDLLRFNIIPEKCIGCTLCARNCPVPCIEGERKKTHNIIQEKCIKCGVCFTKCPVGAIERI